MKTFRIMTACAATMLLASCLQVDEPAGIEAMRNAKAELISAEAQYKLADAAVKAAEAAYQQAIADWQVLQNKMEELQLAKDAADSEQYVAQIEQEMEEALLTHQITILQKQAELAEAEQDYADALAYIEATADRLTDKESELLESYTAKLSDLKSNMSSLNSQMEYATNAYLEAKYDFTFDYELQKAKYQRDIARAKKDLEDRTEFVDYVKALDATTPVADYIAKIDELQTKIDAVDAQITSLEATVASKQESMKLLENEIARLKNQNNDFYIQQAAIITQVSALKNYDNKDVFYKVTISVPAAVADAVGQLIVANMPYDATYTGLVEVEGKLTAPSGKVDVVCQYASVEYFVDALIAAAKLNTELADYVATLETYKKAITDAKAANDKQIASLEVQSVEIDKQIVTNSIKIADLQSQCTALDYEITEINDLYSGDIAVLNDHKSNLETLQETYKGLAAGTTIWVPGNISSIVGSDGSVNIPADDPTTTDYDESQDLGNQVNVNWQQVTINSYGGDAEKLQDAFETWAIYAEYYLLVAQSDLTKMEQRAADFETADNPELYAQELELANLEYQMKITKTQYETTAQLFDYYTKLLKDFLAAVTSGQPVETPPTETPDTPEDTPAEGEQA